MKSPAGTVTISGQSGQSLKDSAAPGRMQRCSAAPISTRMPSQGCADAEHGASEPTTASAIAKAFPGDAIMVGLRHCEERSDEAIQLSVLRQSWIASLRSQ
jgi:hypothetical protein